MRFGCTNELINLFNNVFDNMIFAGNTETNWRSKIYKLFVQLSKTIKKPVENSEKQCLLFFQRSISVLSLFLKIAIVHICTAWKQRIPVFIFCVHRN